MLLKIWSALYHKGLCLIVYIFSLIIETETASHSVYGPQGSSVHGVLQARILEAGSHSLLQGIFLTQGSNPGLLHCRWILTIWAAREAPSKPFTWLSLKCALNLVLPRTKLLNSNVWKLLVFTPRNLQLYSNLLPLSSKSAYNASGLGRSPGEGHGNPYQYSCLENSIDRGAWWATVHGVAKRQIWLSNYTFLKQICCLSIQFADAFIRPTETWDEMQKQGKKYISIYKSCLHLLSILTQVWPAIFFHLEYYSFLPGMYALKS